MDWNLIFWQVFINSLPGYRLTFCRKLWENILLYVLNSQIFLVVVLGDDSFLEFWSEHFLDKSKFQSWISNSQPFSSVSDHCKMSATPNVEEWKKKMVGKKLIALRVKLKDAKTEVTINWCFASLWSIMTIIFHSQFAEFDIGKAGFTHDALYYKV